MDEECSKSLKQLTADSCLLHVDCEKAACKRTLVSPEKPEVSLTEEEQEEYLAPRMAGVVPVVKFSYSIIIFFFFLQVWAQFVNVYLHIQLPFWLN